MGRIRPIFRQPFLLWELSCFGNLSLSFGLYYIIVKSAKHAIRSKIGHFQSFNIIGEGCFGTRHTYCKIHGKITLMYTYITLKQLRELRNYTQKEVAAKIGLTQSAYSKIENFDCQTTMDNYNKIANLFDVEVDQLITNRIQALIHIKTASTTRDQFIEKNAPMVAEIIKSIKEQEFKLSMLLQGVKPM